MRYPLLLFSLLLLKFIQTSKENTFLGKCSAKNPFHIAALPLSINITSSVRLVDESVLVWLYFGCLGNEFPRTPSCPLWSVRLSLFDQTSHNDEIHFAKTNQSCRGYDFAVVLRIFISHRNQCLMFTSLWTEGLIKPTYWTFCITASFSESLRIDSWLTVQKCWMKLPSVLPHKIL